MATILVESGQYAKARAICRQAAEVFPEADIFVTDELAIFCHSKQFDEAEKLADEFIGSPPDVARTLAVGRTLLQFSRFDEARRRGEAALAAAGEDLAAASHLLLGEIALLQGQRDSDSAQLAAARDHFAKVVEQHPTHFVAGNNLAWLLATKFNDANQALEVAERVRGEAPVTTMPLGFIDTLAEVYRGAERWQQASDVLEQALGLYPNNPTLLFHLGCVLAKTGKEAAAVNHLERALSLGGLSEDRTEQAEQLLTSLGK